MSREWKPGDVAMVTWRASGEELVDLRFRSWRAAVGEVWVSTGGDWIGDSTAKDARPLVVIDPEDEGGDLSRLWSILPNNLVSIDQLQAALREFADPKPPCGASLTLGKDGAMYRCSETEGHDGPHLDGTCVWTAKS